MRASHSSRIRQHTSAYVSIRQHTHTPGVRICGRRTPLCASSLRPHTLVA
jgi:hypothetical protein